MRNLQPHFKVTETYKKTITPSCISKNLEISTTNFELQKIWQLRTIEYNKHYSEFSCNDDDNYDENALIIYSKDKHGQIISTGRIVFDSTLGLPADDIVKGKIDNLRAQGLNIAEISKLAISEQAKGMLAEYIQTFYHVAIQQEIEVLIFICKRKSSSIYKRLVGAKVLVKDIQYSYGTGHAFSLLEWRIKESKYHKQHRTLLEAV